MLDAADWTVLGGAAGVFLSLFLPWFGVSGVSGLTKNGWDYALSGVIPLLIAIAMGAYVLVRRFGGWELPSMSLSLGVLEMIVGGVATMLVFVKVAAGEDFLSRRFGIFVTLLSAGALVAGGFVRSRIEPSAGTGVGTS